MGANLLYHAYGARSRRDGERVSRDDLSPGRSDTVAGASVTQGLRTPRRVSLREQP